MHNVSFGCQNKKSYINSERNKLKLLISYSSSIILMVRTSNASLKFVKEEQDIKPRFVVKKHTKRTNQIR